MANRTLISCATKLCEMKIVTTSGSEIGCTHHELVLLFECAYLYLNSRVKAISHECRVIPIIGSVLVGLRLGFDTDVELARGFTLNSAAIVLIVDS